MLGFCITLFNVEIYCKFYVIQGAKAWYIPSTVCGILGIFVSSLVLMLPETKGTVLPDTPEDMKITSSVKVTNCCTFQ